MTQLYIDGREAVLPQNFSVTVKRENSFFTKNGEYTYDVTLRLDNDVNQSLFGFLGRINKSEQVSTERSAILVADGHVYCRGTEIITRWTEQTVTLQIVSGESELNYFIGQDKKISELDLGEIEWEDIATPFIENIELCYPDIDYCMPTIVEEGKEGSINFWIYNEDLDADRRWYEFGGTIVNTKAPQPYLCAVLRRLFTALGYELGVFELEDTQFKNLFFVNRKYTRRYNEMFAGWTVKDLLEEVEKLTNCCFLTDNNNMRLNVLLRHTFYLTANQFTIRNVVDAYEAEVDTDEQNADISTADIIYDFDNEDTYNIMRLPEVISQYVEYHHYSNFEQLRQALETLSPTAKVIGVNDETGRKYVRRQDTSDETEWEGSEMNRRRQLKLQKLDEVDQFADLRREDGNGEVELKLIPAPMGTWTASMQQTVTEEGQYGEIGLQMYGGLVAIPAITIPQSDTSTVDPDEEGDPQSVIDLIKSAEEKSEGSQIKLYIAFYNGLHGPFVGNTTSFMVGVAYTDAEHAFAFGAPADTITYEGSLRTVEIDAATYSYSYKIDTRHSITIETYDPNVIDVRQVYVIRNKRFVVRDVEEVITADGRQPKWKGTFYPITISDEALEKRWVLTKGVWDDGAAWLDDGRWNDGPSADPSPTPTPDPDPTPTPDPEEEEPDSMFVDALDIFSGVNIPTDGTTYNHLLSMYSEAREQFFEGKSLNGLPLLYSQSNYPTISDYYGTVQQRQLAFQKMVAWLFAMTLAELKPSLRDSLYQEAYDYLGSGKAVPVFYHRFDSDINVARLAASAIYATMRDGSKIAAMRTEVGGSTIAYTSSSYEILVDTRPFMPQAPGPYLSDHDVNSRQGATPTYGESPGGYPVGDANADHNLVGDQDIYDYVVATYNLDSANADIRQRTVQAIADKEHELPHLFGGSRTVTDPTYGTLTFQPVFGAHNIGVTISPAGAIASLVSAVVMDCSRTRESLLHQQYGRRRPGQGLTDGTAKDSSRDRALVNFAIEEGDGHTTGYYNQDGDYIKRSDDTHIGDYVEYFQRQMSANSYPSGHSAYIWGAAVALMEVMPDRADRIMRAANDFAQSRVIARYHWMSDTIHGRVIGSVMIPVEHALTNVDYASLLAAAKSEYQALT